MSQNPIGVINVQLGNQKAGRVQSISYGGQGQSIKTMNDISLLGASDGDVISYVANTNSFEIGRAHV